MINALLNESEVLTQLIAGDQAAFNIIYHHYRSHISAFAFRFTKSKPAADEITQEVFIKLWEHRDQVELGHNFDSYIKTIARNHILNQLKKVARDKLMQQALIERMKELKSNEDPVIENELEQLHRAAIISLPPRQKITYLLRQQEGLSYAEIAAQLHVSKHTVKNNTLEAIRNIRRQLAGMLR